MNDAWLKAKLQAAIRLDAERIITEEAKDAASRVNRRLMELVDKIALDVLAEYDFVSDGKTLTIRVRKVAEGI